MKKLGISTIAIVLVLALAAPTIAFATNHTGYDYGQHHAAHARQMGGFSGVMNPGVMHRGFSGWHAHHGHHGH